MKQKIKEILAQVYNRDSDSRNLVAAVQLEKLFDTLEQAKKAQNDFEWKTIILQSY